MIYNLDCFDFFDTYAGDKINLVVVDLPYGQIKQKWDVKIDLKKMWICLKKICSARCKFVFFTTTKFGVDLINSNPLYFRYDLVWKKKNSVGYLSANKAPLRKHEMIYIFEDKNGWQHRDRTNFKELRDYSKGLFEWIGKTRNDIFKECGNYGLCHFMAYTGIQFGIPKQKNYQFLIDMYKINEYPEYITFENLTKIYKQKLKKRYNPQKTKGKPYKTAGGNIENSNYGKRKASPIDNKGNRFPTSVLKFGHDKENIHPTQKPVALCEWLIKTYSDKGDLVLDFTMGSGSTGVACENTERRFIGVEKDTAIFNTAEQRLNNED
jgi:site-specific DNA-methyltransferase (adenine-specific)